MSLSVRKNGEALLNEHFPSLPWCLTDDCRSEVANTPAWVYTRMPSACETVLLAGEENRWCCEGCPLPDPLDRCWKFSGSHTNFDCRFTGVIN